MKKTQNYLPAEHALTLLQESFGPIRREYGYRKIFSSSRGKIYFAGSKHYDGYNVDWWYTIDPDWFLVNKVSYLVLAADFKGIFVIPAMIFLAYRERHSVGAVKGGRERFSIRQVGSRYVRKESKCEEEDITKYFIPAANR